MRFRSAKTHLENERVARRENIRASVCAARMLSLRQNKNPSFPGHAPGKDTLRAANAATKTRFTWRKQNKRSEFCCLPVLICLPVVLRKGVNGGKREGERSERESVVPRLNLSLRQNKNSSFPGHAPGKDTLRAANAATKTRFTGRKRTSKRSAQRGCCRPRHINQYACFSHP